MWFDCNLVSGWHMIRDAHAKCQGGLTKDASHFLDLMLMRLVLLLVVTNSRKHRRDMKRATLLNSKSTSLVAASRWNHLKTCCGQHQAGEFTRECRMWKLALRQLRLACCPGEKLKLPKLVVLNCCGLQNLGAEASTRL